MTATNPQLGCAPVVPLNQLEALQGSGKNDAGATWLAGCREL